MRGGYENTLREEGKGGNVHKKRGGGGQVKISYGFIISVQTDLNNNRKVVLT